MTPNLQIEYRAIDALLPYARNPRTHSPAQIAKIAASIVEFGWTQPILVDGDNGIIAGHGRLAAARKLELAEVPVIELSHLSTAQKRAYVIADNRLALDAGWDEELLALELAELSETGYDLLMTGFDDDELAQMLVDIEETDGSETDEEPASDEDDDVPETPKQPITRAGDVWQLGSHRLICGDASDPTVIAMLMQGEQASLCFTSPPYGNQRDYTSGGISDWDGLMRGVFAQVPMAADGQVLVNLGLIHRDNEFIPYWDQWLEWMRTQGWRRFAWYVWDQGPGMPGDWQGRLAPSFEFIFHFNRQTRKPNKTVPCKFAGQETHLRADGSSTAMRGKDRPILNDNLGDGFSDFLLAAMTPMLARSSGAIYVAMSSSELDTLQSAFRAAGGKWSTFIIWAKNTFTLGRADYQRQYEPILYGWPEGQNRHWCGDRDQGDVWNIKKPQKNDLHPTMKPVELVERAIRNSSRPGDIVLDPFGGSGTTLIAAEKSGRIGWLIELDPKYVDVIVRRWQDWTGQKAYREADAVKFNDLAGIGSDDVEVPA